jgi:hypothetical protein
MAASPIDGRAPSDTYPESHPRPLRIDCDLFYRIVEAGVFGDKPRVFLWDGQIVEWVGRTPKGRRHAHAINVVGAFLRKATPPGWYVEEGLPIEIGNDCDRDADLKIVRGGPRDYREQVPRVHDTPLVVEVSDADLGYDRGELLRAYAAAALPLYRVVNVRDRAVEVYTKPTGPVEHPRFESRRDFGPDDDVPLVLDGREVGRIAVREVLP